MPVPITLRVDQKLKDHLAKLSGLRRMPMNKLINQALTQFVHQETTSLQEELEASLAVLKEYQKSDPIFDQAIESVVNAETSTLDDPAQGTVEFPEDYETTKRLRGLLSA